MGTPEVTEHAFSYLQKSYQLVRRSAAANNFRDVVYTSFMLFVYEFLRPMEEHNCEAGFQHCLGLWNSLNALKATLVPGTSTDELMFMETLWACTLRTEYICINRHSASPKRIYSLLRTTTSMLQWHKSSDRIYRRIHALSILFRMFMHYYLLQRNHAVNEDFEEERFIAGGLTAVMHEIIILGPWILEAFASENTAGPKLFSALLDRRPPTPSEIWGITVLYNLARLANHTLQPASSDAHRLAAVDASMSLCHLHTQFSPSFIDLREVELLIMGLVIPGLVLAQCKDEPGTPNSFLM